MYEYTKSTYNFLNIVKQIAEYVENSGFSKCFAVCSLVSLCVVVCSYVFRGQCPRSFQWVQGLFLFSSDCSESVRPSGCELRRIPAACSLIACSEGVTLCYSLELYKPVPRFGAVVLFSSEGAPPVSDPVSSKKLLRLPGCAPQDPLRRIFSQVPTVEACPLLHSLLGFFGFELVHFPAVWVWTCSPLLQKILVYIKHSCPRFHFRPQVIFINRGI